MNHQQYQNHDELRARFTKWLETLLYRAKLKYVRKMEKQVKTVSLEDIPESSLPLAEPCSNNNQKTFDFEESKLAEAFYNLPIKRQKILEMLFVENKEPKEIANELNCTVQHIYNQRSLSLKKLRLQLQKGDDRK